MWRVLGFLCRCSRALTAAHTSRRCVCHRKRHPPYAHRLLPHHNLSLDHTGEFDGVKGSLLTPQKTLTSAFPDKAADPTWGTWSGPFFGCYVAADPTARGRVVRVGDAVDVVERRGTARVGMSWARGVPVDQVLAAVIAMIIGVVIAIAVKRSDIISQFV